MAGLGLAAVGFEGRYVTRAMLILGVSPSANIRDPIYPQENHDSEPP